MFWIGLIVGIVLGWLGYGLYAVRLGAKASNMTLKEFWDCSVLIVEAGHNRESTMSVWHDGETIGVVELDKK